MGPNYPPEFTTHIIPYWGLGLHSKIQIFLYISQSPVLWLLLYSQENNRKICQLKMGPNCPADFIIWRIAILKSDIPSEMPIFLLNISITYVVTIALQCGLQSGEK